MEWAESRHHALLKITYEIIQRKFNRRFVYSQHDIGRLKSKDPETMKEEDTYLDNNENVL